LTVQEAIRKKKGEENAAIAAETTEETKKLTEDKQQALEEKKRADDELGYRTKAAQGERQHADYSRQMIDEDVLKSRAAEAKARQE